MHAASLICRPPVGTQINVAVNERRTNRKAPDINPSLQTIVPVAPRQIHICPRHSQLSVIAHAIAWVHFVSLFLRDYLHFSLLPSLPPRPICLSPIAVKNGQDQDH